MLKKKKYHLIIENGRLKSLFQTWYTLLFWNKSRKIKELLPTLHSINLELEIAYQVARKIPVGDKIEEAVLQGIRALENSRFDLLSQINGSNLQAYRAKTEVIPKFQPSQ